MDLLGENRVCTVAMAKGVTRDYKSFKEAQFYYANEDALDEMYTTLSQNSLTIHKLENGIVSGSVYVPDNNKLLFTSIPYDDGWSVKAEGNEVEIVPLLDGAFLGVKFPEEGTYELTFSYDAPGLRLGICISLCSWGIFLLGCFGSVYRRKRT